MRVVELADEFGMTSGDALDLCDRLGIAVSDGASEVASADVERFRQALAEPLPEPTREPEAPTSVGTVDWRDLPAEVPRVAVGPERRWTSTVATVGVVAVILVGAFVAWQSGAFRDAATELGSQLDGAGTPTGGAGRIPSVGECVIGKRRLSADLGEHLHRGLLPAPRR